jgi:dynein heavy chain
MEEASLVMVFSTILNGFLTHKGFGDDIKELSGNIIQSAINVYYDCMEKLLPTPAKSHYTFNLRDLSKVFQGVLNATPKNMSTKEIFLRLWIHESCRVFQDRLVDEIDRGIFTELLTEQLKENFQLDMKELCTADRLIFGDYTDGVNADPKVYVEIPDMEGVRKMIDDYLEDYDSESKQPMRLVLFMDAIEHVSRINRILRLPLGNALLCGVGGSGRKSLTRLAAFMADYQIFMIEIAKNYGMNEWREDVKKVLRTSGMDNLPIVFLFDDTQIVVETFLEDINNILNSGEVPNIWKEDELGEIFTTMTPIVAGKGQQASKLNMMNEFISRVKSNIHLVVCMSPIGDEFVLRLRKFPSLVNCCTIDWFSEWPYEALKSVAGDKCGDVDMGDCRPAVYEMFVYIHQSVEAKSKDFLMQLRRYNYVTPTSYLELLTTFQTLLAEKQTELTRAISRLDGGLKKIDDAEQLVDVLKVELADKMPVLVKTQAEVEEMMVVIAADKEAAQVVEQEASTAEADAMEKKATAEGIQAEAQGKLDVALPALYAALANVDKLQKKDIDEMKALQNPPARVKQVMAAVCIYAKEKPTKVADPNDPKKKIDDYWKQSQGLLRDAKAFVAMLKEYDKDATEESVIKKITPFVEDEDLDNDKVKSTSSVAYPIMLWVRAMYDYYFVSKEVEPLRQAAASAAAQLETAMASLAEAQAKLKAVQDKLAVLEQNYKGAVDKKNALQADVDLTNLKLVRADKLLGGLGGERSRWKETVAKLKVLKDNIMGNVVVASGSIAYLGVFTALYRQDLTKLWQDKLVETGVPTDLATATIRGTLEDAVKVRQWAVEGLPSDSLSIENAICMDKARRWPLCIDPQRQANKWIKSKEKENLGDDGIVKASDSGSKLQRALENAVRFGRTLLLENVMESLDPSLEPVLLRQTFKQGGSVMMKLGDSVIAYDPNFKFFLTTNLRNPHYTPEVAVKVSLLNFLITPDGLEEQLLGVLVSKERPDCEEKKNELVINNARMSKELTDLEDNILALLEKSGADILDEDTLINALADSKKMKDEITVQMDAAAITEKEIDEARERYRPCAYRSQLIYFCVADLAGVDSMYQYSLTWFKVVFVNSLLQSEPAEDFDKRIEIINDHFTLSTYDNVCRGIFEADKLLFSMTLAIKLLQGYDKIDAAEWRFLLAGPSGTDTALPNPSPNWITEKMWIEFSKLSLLPAFNGLDVDIASNSEEYMQVFDDAFPQDLPYPKSFAEKWNSFQHLLYLRCLRQDKMMPAMSNYVTEQMGEKFIKPPIFDLSVSYSQASSTMPLIFILSPGSDPTESLFKFSETMNMRQKTHYISLGQGQDTKAEKLIDEGVIYGHWVLLQNCHLYKSWMPVLEKKIENFSDENNREFRLWLTSLPSPHFPVSILESGVKIVNEPPAGLKANMSQTYATMGQEFLDRSRNPNEYRKCLFGLCLCHAVVLERRKFGPLGFNISYGFTQGDCDVGKEQLYLLLEDYDTIPFKVIRVLVTDINYGGRVTDDWDRRYMTSMIKVFENPEMWDPEYKFSASGKYRSVDANTIDEYLEAINQFPTDAQPEVFGFHDNAEITCATDQANTCLTKILGLQPRTGAGAGKSREDIIDELAVNISQRVEGPYDMEPVMKMYPVDYNESMNTVLQQEIVRYNKLLAEMKKSLADIRKALVGQLVMTDELDSMGTKMFNQMVPDNWSNKSYPSLKPLAAWTNDLLQRLDFLNDWIENGIPLSFWISGFFFPQAFLTGALQNFARKYQKAIDTISFETVVLKIKDKTEVTQKPNDGCYIWGLYMEGARWNAEDHTVDESRPKELYTQMVPIHLLPVEKRVVPTEGIYICPVYKILTRAGVLSTTGHSTNYVCPLELPSATDPDHWIRRGVALFTMLRF